MPFCVSSFAALVKDEGFVLIFPPSLEQNLIGITAIAAFLLLVAFLRRWDRGKVNARVDEMLAMGKEVGGDEYEWEAGHERPSGSPLPIPYLIGVPRSGRLNFIICDMKKVCKTVLPAPDCPMNTVLARSLWFGSSRAARFASEPASPL